MTELDRHDVFNKAENDLLAMIADTTVYAKEYKELCDELDEDVSVDVEEYLMVLAYEIGGTYLEAS